MHNFDSVGNGLRSLVISTGLFGDEDRVYLDYAPVNPVVPYCTYNPNIGTASNIKGDGKVQQWTTQYQVDYWTTPEAESTAHILAIRDALNGARFRIVPSGERVSVKVSAVDRIPEPQGDRLAHYAFTGEAVYGSDAV